MTTFPLRLGGPNLVGMLTPDDLAEVERDAAAIYARARLRLDDSPSMDLLCLRLIGSKPQRRIIGREADIFPGAGGRWVLRVHRTAPRDRARFLTGHELAEWWYRRRVWAGGHLEREAWCDALGAALVTPRPAFLLAVRDLENRVHRLAEAFEVPRALAMLRVGEVTGRPVLYPLRGLARGAPFGWPAGLGRTPGVHPIRLDRGELGLMARA